MKALILKKDKTLSFKEVPNPKLSLGEVRVKIKASALNHREIWIQKGLYPGMTLPCILGADGAGIVHEVSENIDPSWIGKEVIIYPAYDWGEKEQAPRKSFRVLGMPDPGTISEFINIPIKNLVEKPAYLSWEEAAAIPVASLTAWRALVRHGQINSGHKVLITGIGGGVAQAGFALALAFGAEVFVTSSDPEKIKLAIKQGAIGGVNYKEDDWHLQLKEITGAIDIILDSSPHPVLDNYLKFMNYGGRIVAYGATAVPRTTVNISKFFLRHIQLIGTAMGSPKEFRQLMLFMEKHKVKPIIHSKHKLENAIDAIKELQLGNQIGKIVIIH